MLKYGSNPFYRGGCLLMPKLMRSWGKNSGPRQWGISGTKHWTEFCKAVKSLKNAHLRPSDYQSQPLSAKARPSTSSSLGKTANWCQQTEIYWAYFHSSKICDLSRGWPEGSIYNSYYTEVLGRTLLHSLDCSTLPLILSLYCWVLNKLAASTIFESLVWLDPGLLDHWRTLYSLDLWPGRL